MTNSRNQNENDFFINLAVSLGISLMGVTAIGIAASSINYALDRLSQTAQNRQAELWNNKPWETARSAYKGVLRVIRSQMKLRAVPLGLTTPGVFLATTEGKPRLLPFPWMINASDKCICIDHNEWYKPASPA